MILVTGGARSGKSTFAENLAQKKGNKVFYIATAVPFDEEMAERIEIHRQRRSKDWVTYEGYLNLYTVIEENKNKYDCILLDCVTILITNLLFYFANGKEPEQMNFEELEHKIMKQLELLLCACRQLKQECIFVTNEIGLGIVPQEKFGRKFRDIAGKANQLIAEYADKVYFVVSGIPMQIKGEKE